MAYTNTAYRLYYAAKNFTPGLTDVRYYVYKPDGTKLGPYIMQELNSGIASGIYFDDFLDGDIEGNYIFIVNSASNPKQSEESVFFDPKIWQVGDRDLIVSLLTFIKDTEKGNWEIVGTQMIFYKEDGTELMRFNLMNEAGLSTNGVTSPPFKRIRI